MSSFFSDTNDYIERATYAHNTSGFVIRFMTSGCIGATASLPTTLAAGAIRALTIPDASSALDYFHANANFIGVGSFATLAGLNVLCETPFLIKTIKNVLTDAPEAYSAPFLLLPKEQLAQRRKTMGKLGLLAAGVGILCSGLLNYYNEPTNEHTADTWQFMHKNRTDIVQTHTPQKNVNKTHVFITP